MTDDPKNIEQKKKSSWLDEQKALLDKMTDDDFEQRKILAENKRQAREDKKKKIQDGIMGAGSDANENATTIQKTIVSKGEFPPENNSLVPYPTSIARVSPFFPMSKNLLNQKRIIFDEEVLTESSWGRLTYTGHKLSTYDEDALIGILVLLDQHKYRQYDTVEGKCTYTYQGSLRALLLAMGLKNPNDREYENVVKSLKRMVTSTLSLEIYKRSKRKDVKKKKIIERSNTVNILIFADWVEAKNGEKKFKITINPYFAELYGQGFTSLIDTEIRNKLKKPTSKCLHRFMSSQKENKWPGDFMSLAPALNLDIENQPKYQIKRQIKEAVIELVNVGYLTKESGFIGNTKTIIMTKIPRKKRNQGVLPKK